MKKYYFHNNQISEYGCEKGFVDYRAFAGFSHILNNDILNDLQLAGYEFDFENLFTENDDEVEERYIYQWYIVPSTPIVFDVLKEAGECYAYCERLDLLLWGVDHYGTAWDYTLTSIPVTKEV